MSTSTIRRGPIEDAILRIPDEGEVLRASGLRVGFARGGATIDVVRGVDFSLHAGRSLVLLGESGSGKSVTARALLRLSGAGATASGSVRLGESELLRADERLMRGLRGGAIGMVPQDPSASLDPLRRIGAQLTEVLVRHDVEPDTRRAKVAAQALLERVGTPDPARILAARPFELSGGLRQRVAIAMAIAGRPRVLIADEPTTALDVTVQAQVLELFEELTTQLRMALLLVTHDVGVARIVADEVAVMYAGRFVEHGPAAAVLDRPAHPYTAGLLDALPRPGVARGALRAIAGRPPAPGEPGLDARCALEPRCPFAQPQCAGHRPPLEAVAPDHLAACDVVGGRVPTLPLDGAAA